MTRNKRDYRIRMICTATESTTQNHHQGRHGPVLYALLTNQANLAEPGEDIVMVYTEHDGEWIELPNPTDFLNG